MILCRGYKNNFYEVRMFIFNNIWLCAMMFFLNGCSDVSKSSPSKTDLIPQKPKPLPEPPISKHPAKKQGFDLQNEAIKIQKDLECIRGRPFLSDPSVAFQSMPDFSNTRTTQLASQSTVACLLLQLRLFHIYPP